MVTEGGKRYLKKAEHFTVQKIIEKTVHPKQRHSDIVL